MHDRYARSSSDRSRSGIRYANATVDDSGEVQGGYEESKSGENQLVQELATGRLFLHRWEWSGIVEHGCGSGEEGEGGVFEGGSQTGSEGQSSWNERFPCAGGLAQMSRSISLSVYLSPPSFRRTDVYMRSDRYLVSGNHPPLFPHASIPFLQLERRYRSARRDRRHLREKANGEMRRSAQYVLPSPPHPSLKQRCADRTFSTNIPTLEVPPHDSLHALVKSLNPPIVTENSPDPYGPIPSTSESDEEWYTGSDLYQAVDLMERCLEMDLTRRWTAEECLDHPFFDGEYAPHGRRQP